MTTYHWMFGSLLSLTSLSYGCSPIALSEYTFRGMGTYEYRQSKEGLEIAIEPITKRDDVEKYFGTNLLSEKILPVLIIAKNQSSDASYIFRKDRVELVPGNLRPGKTSEPSTADRAAQAVTTGALLSQVGVIGFPPLSMVALPLILVGGKMSADASEIKYNLVLRELHTRTISSGAVVSGFVYFKIPEGQSLSESWLVHADVWSPQSATSISFDIPFKFK